MTYQSILAAVDMDLPFKRILQGAAQMARKSGGRVTAMTAVPDLRAYFHGTENTLQTRFYSDFQEQAVERIREACREVKLSDVHVEVVQGDADRAFAEAAKRHKADLIVFGNHDRHGLAHYIGGVGLGLLHRASCDLLAINTTGPLPLWESPLIALAGDEHDAHLLSTARHNFPDQTLNVVHVLHSDLADYLKAVLPNAIDRSALVQVAHLRFEELTRKFAPCTVHIESGKPSEAIEKSAKTLNRQLIIMGSGRHTPLGWHLGSTAHNLLSDAPADVLLIRPLTSA